MLLSTSYIIHGRLFRWRWTPCDYKPRRGQGRARTNRESLRSGGPGGCLGRRSLLRALGNAL
eukprot:3186101-Pyramimonas_sp.AAC.1